MFSTPRRGEHYKRKRECICNFQKCQNWEFSQKPGHLGSFPKTWTFKKFPKNLGIWEISQKPGHLGNFPKTWAFWKFPKNLGILKISQKPGHLGNFQKTWVFGKFLKSYKYTNIRFQQEFGKTEEFPKCCPDTKALEKWGNTCEPMEVPKLPRILEISQTP